MGGIKDRGFASMTPERRREIARKGGRRAHQLGVANRWTPEEARAAGQKAVAARAAKAKGEVS